MSAGAWEIRIDTGGTFTDGVADAPDGSRHRVKILSTGALRGRVAAHLTADLLEVQESWDAPAGLVDGFAFRLLGASGSPEPTVVASYEPASGRMRLTPAPRESIAPGTAFEVASPEQAPLLAARMLTRTPGRAPLPPARLRLATTLGTNALLERRGAPTALFVTAGFGDLLRIGTQQREELFRLDVRRPEPLHAAVVEVPERLDASGAVLRRLDVATLEPAARELVSRGIVTAAVALLHAYRDPRHERELAETLLGWGFRHVSCSAALAPRIRVLPRAATALCDAYLAPIVGGYLERVAAGLAERNGPAAARGAELHVMTSAGGLLDAASFRPKDSLLSGPAGGVVGAAAAGRSAGLSRLISFDMGGTSTDVARIDRDYEYRFDVRVGDVELLVPALAIETVAAGGGSVCRLDGERLRVGPESAGARPGPACYGAGGPLTLTDVNLLLGRLSPERFEIPIEPAHASARLADLVRLLEEQSGEPAEPRAVLDGLVAVADETMAEAIRRVSVRRGYDPARYTLVAFGGAGGQHACGVAERLGIARVLLPTDAALLSAYGLGQAVLERFVERQVLQPLDRAVERLPALLAELGQEARRAVVAAGAAPRDVRVRRRTLRLRFEGQDRTLDVPWGRDVNAAFDAAYLALYGHRPDDRRVELESVVVVASSRAPHVARAGRGLRPGEPSPERRSPGARVLERTSLAPGSRLRGPALVVERHSATWLAPGWSAEVRADGALLLSRRRARHERRDEAARPDAIRLELFTQRFAGIVREMGERLERTAVSTNVKERLDFSCGLLDAQGALVANAPHIPVHLGALGPCVRSVAARLPLGPGDVAVTNHPAYGGSHLPDVTVVTPVFLDDDGQRLLGYVASRAHHAEIGGSRPGSMPPAARRLDEEGVVLAPLLLVERGQPRFDVVRRLLLEAPHPTRRVEDNLADLRAAVAANHAGAQALVRLAREHGADTVADYMERLADLASERIGQALARLPRRVHEATERLDDGSPLAVRVTLDSGRARIDFSGTAGVHPGNLNATAAIVRSAVIYVLRLLLAEPLPLNEGLLRGVTLEIPRGLLDPPFPDDPRDCPAVVGGNVETSQRLVDTLLKALGLVACSQGTMNNVLFGSSSFGYYETLGGGCGAGPGWAGASAVHSHMTNTRITDVEVLETRYPVRVERFAIRRGSGGAGRFRGGDGIVRELVFLDEVDLSVLSQHRVERPFGLAGGEPGACGAQRVVRADGEVVTLGSIDGCRLRRGDRLIVETPGGGGYGDAG